MGQRQRAEEGIDLKPSVAAGVQRADNGAHAGADDEVRSDAGAVENLEHANVCEALRASARKHQRSLGRLATLSLERFPVRCAKYECPEDSSRQRAPPCPANPHAADGIEASSSLTRRPPL